MILNWDIKLREINIYVNEYKNFFMIFPTLLYITAILNSGNAPSLITNNYICMCRINIYICRRIRHVWEQTEYIQRTKCPLSKIDIGEPQPAATLRHFIRSVCPLKFPLLHSLATILCRTYRILFIYFLYLPEVHNQNVTCQ